MSTQIRFSYVAAASFLAVVLIALLATQASPTAASADGAPKIAVIDTEKILLSSATGKNALAALKKAQEQAEAEARARQQEIKDLQQKIQDGQQSLPESQLAQLKKQLEEKTTALSRWQDDTKRDLDKKRDNILADIDQKVMPVLNQIGKELGYTVIFRKFESGLIYADDTIDITAVIIQRLDTGGFVLPPPTRPGAPASRIDTSASGNVGVGTSSPASILTVQTTGADIAGEKYLRVRNTTSFTGLLLDPNQAGDVDWLILGGFPGAGDFTVRQFGGANYLTIKKNTGRVGIGTAAPDQLLSVNGEASKVGSGSWQSFSDERLKNIKGGFNIGLKAVMQLEPIRYEYKRDNALGLKSEGEHIGFGAQALQKVIPEAVSKNGDGYLMVNNDPVLWTMLNAIKEQQKEIAELKGQVRKLRATSGRRRE